VNTALLFREDAYLRDCRATVTAINDKGGIVLDRTVSYATAGGQPGDKGTLHWDGGTVAIATTVYDAAKDVVHVPAAGATLPGVGARVTLTLDWDNRYRTMRAHTLMHLLCASVPFPVTGSARMAAASTSTFRTARSPIRPHSPPRSTASSTRITRCPSAGSRTRKWRRTST